MQRRIFDTLLDGTICYPSEIELRESIAALLEEADGNELLLSPDEHAFAADCLAALADDPITAGMGARYSAYRSRI